MADSLLQNEPLRLYAGIRARLLERRASLEERAERIRTDRRRTQKPLDADWPEQAIELENDQVLDALDASTRFELEQVRHALDRLERDEFGSCVRCGERISGARLDAVPTATLCRACAISERPRADSR